MYVKLQLSTGELPGKEIGPYFSAAGYKMLSRSPLTILDSPITLMYKGREICLAKGHQRPFSIFFFSSWVAENCLLCVMRAMYVKLQLSTGELPGKEIGPYFSAAGYKPSKSGIS
jgi:hypothetical protein